MKTLPTGLAAHLAQGETTTAHCWRVVRKDGVVLGFTDHDCSLVVSGTTCAPTFGLDAGEMPARLGAQVETGEVLGVLDSAAIDEEDILLGRYDGARVESWLVNWADASQCVLLRVDTIGEIAREDGLFRAELRSPQQALNVTRGRLYQGTCDAALGDARCKVSLDHPARRGTAIVIEVIDPFQVLVSGLASFADGAFAFGMAAWSDGKQQGLKDAILTHRRAPDGDVLGFAEKIGLWVEVGDTLAATVGCDRRWTTCKERFGNEVNFRGFPHIPGSDYVLRHPRSGDAMDGRAVVP